MELTPKQRKFVNEYCVDENATQAAIRAGYSKETAGVIGHETLKKPYIAAAIEQRRLEVAVTASVTPEMIISQWLQIANADVNDIVQLRRECCRHCYGFDHEYQWTETEYRQAVDKAIATSKPAPECGGGFGYDANREPVEGCPGCHGQGVERAHINDTRKLTGAARRLYAGIQKTKDGYKVLFRDQDKALENLAKWLAMFVERKEVSGPNGGPIPIGVSASDLTDDQLAAIAAGNAAPE